VIIVQQDATAEGLMGIQIASYMIQNRIPTILKTRTGDGKKAAYAKMQKIISKKANNGNGAQSWDSGTLQCLKVSTDYRELKNCDLIIEAISENISLKKEIFDHLSEVCKPSTIFSTNSSSLSIDDIASATGRPDKFIGIHFFNPVSHMSLVEVVIGTATSFETRAQIIDFVLKIGKNPVVVKDSPGYIVNRLLLPQINEAIRMFEEGIATKEDIDSAIRLGLRHPMGPFQLADFIGLDTCLSILSTLPKCKPPKLLQDMVKEGKLGNKSGEGFYKYGK
jgi:3-hydroxybutyryl-CoA dehydrogenase